MSPGMGRYIFMKTVGLDFDATAAGIVTEFDKGFRRFDSGLQFVRFGMIKPFIAAHPDQRYRAVGKAFFDLLALVAI